MRLTFAPNGHLQIDDATLIWKNFEGRESMYNRAGDRNFSIVIDTQEMADALINDRNQFGVGWNVKIKPSNDGEEAPFMHLPVKIKFNNRGPNVYLQSGDKTVQLDEDMIACLDTADIVRVDLDIRPYDDEFGGKPFRSAYLQGMHVIQELDRFAERFAGGY